MVEVIVEGKAGLPFGVAWASVGFGHLDVAPTCSLPT